jgi:excinuclease UvrABC nuclease subunit
MSIYKPGRPFKYDPNTGNGHEPPKKPGEYRIRYNSGDIVYIGETCNLYRRMKEHMHKNKLPVGGDFKSSIEYKVADGRSTSSTRREHEQQKIKQHKPLLNRSKGGEGRPAGR